MADPIVLALEIADEGTYKGQVQIIGGPANTANPPKVDVTIPPITITSVEVTGGALNAATPVIVQTNGDDAAVAPSSTQPVGGALNTANPPKVTVASAEIVGGALNTATPPSVNIANSPTVVVASTQPVGGALNTATQPRMQTIGGDATFPSSTQPVGGALNTATPPSVNVANSPTVVVASTQPVGGALNTATPPSVNIANSPTVVVASTQPVGGALNTATQPRMQTIGGDATFPSSTQPVGGTLNTASPAAEVPMRPSQLVSGTRTYHTRNATATGAGDIGATVAPKRFYVTSIVFSVVVSGAAATAIKIVDNGGAGDLIPFVAPTPGATANSTSVQSLGYSMSFQEPLQFSAVPRVVVVGAGATITWACTLVGYLE